MTKNLHHRYKRVHFNEKTGEKKLREDHVHEPVPIPEETMTQLHQDYEEKYFIFDKEAMVPFCCYVEKYLNEVKRKNYKRYLKGNLHRDLSD
jgi:hypothetical protein